MHEDDTRVDITVPFLMSVSSYAFAESNQFTNLAATFCKHEGEKYCAYEECVQGVERGSFTPVVFSSFGGMGKAAKVMHRRLANLLSDKCRELSLLLDYGLGLMFSQFLPATFLIDVPSRFPP